MKDFSRIHTFVVSAYEESKFLEESIKSLAGQTVKSKIIITTSTPNTLIGSIAKKYNIPVIVNPARKSNIGKDFNFALSQGDTPLVTIAHQDDKYEPDYTEKIISAYKRNDDAIIFFTDYYEIVDGKRIAKSKLLRVKRILLTPIKINNSTRFFKRLILSFGNPILCPSVTFNTKKITEPPFDVNFKSNVDWYAWERLSRQKGKFIYIPQKLSYHRIHSGQETAKTIENSVRIKEDYEMFKKFWPSWIAKIICKFYKKSESIYKQS